MNKYYFLNAVGFAALLALLVIVLGAYVRLTDAGLGCPDWPGCYGKLLGVPQQSVEIERAQAEFPGRRVEVDKAWSEMVHRYFAGGLGLIILLLTVAAFVAYKERRKLMLFLLGLVIFQAILGMWTVTLQLRPIVVVAHLLGGFAVLAMLWWLYLDKWFETKPSGRTTAFYKATLIALILLIMQIILGGWTSSNYAALACVDFPRCQGQWLPDANYSGVFGFGESGRNYEYGVLNNPQRTAIHFFHRLGALIVVVFFVIFLTKLLLQGSALIKRAALAVAALLIIQVALGISNVLFSLPLTVAVLHNVSASLLLLSVLLLLRVLKLPQTS